jgi:hypothetical protein
VSSPAPKYIIVGRSRDCDLMLVDPTVSARHARLSWEKGAVVVEDLGSANGTFVRGKRIERALIRPGDDLRFGRAPLRWGSAEVRPFLRAGAGGDTVQGISIPGRRFICGACGARGLMPAGFRRGQVRCPRCEATLEVGPPRRFSRAKVSAFGIGAAAVVVAAFFFAAPSGPRALRDAAERLLPHPNAGDARSPQEASIRRHTVGDVVAALDARHPTTRNTAVQIASTEEGPFSIEQVAKLWSHVRGRWHYVNDPRGQEYFARASESIVNGYAGDCDDFAIVLGATIEAIGGEARVVMMDGPGGGHAYAEACLTLTPNDVRDRLVRYYRGRNDPNLGRQSFRTMHYRQSEGCPVWLNLDWNAGFPGGPYEPETWAVAIYPDASTETLGPAAGPSPARTTTANVGTSSPPSD